MSTEDRSPASTTILTFDTTHHALWAEQIVNQHRLGAQVVPAPAAAAAKCDLALECLNEDLPALQRALEEAGIAFAVFNGSSGDDADDSSVGDVIP